jgi:hypothetical protein
VSAERQLANIFTKLYVMWALRGNLPISSLAKVLCFEKWAKYLGFS